MRVLFEYSREKDVENFTRSTKSVNNPNPTELFLEFSKKYSAVDEESVGEFLAEYIKENNIDISQKCIEIENKWRKVEQEYFKRVEQIFKIKYPVDTFTAYLTAERRCTYNTSKNYFFVSVRSNETHRTVMHEIFHFYTWHAFHEALIGRGVTEMAYNDIKESLTELLNIEFVDLLDGAVDYGYPQHKDMRNSIRSAWLQEKHLKKVIDSIVPAE